ncbi:hypothetical protein HHX25_07375 [Flavivirga sp. Y03]|uniref:YCII-related domain-containing protein n=2 Tax=Flavivirga algicola TaxID=2729136 RepID=A0ABX1RYN2_9FLAO|nr:hypothetical protein [Flavivirga algicola]
MTKSNLYIVILRFSENKKMAPQFMKAHLQWIDKGFNDKIFLLTGSLVNHSGGTILAYNTSFENLQEFIQTDPFVKENIVTPEILGITPSRIHENIALE